jgi:hypothetical protein
MEMRDEFMTRAALNTKLAYRSRGIYNGHKYIVNSLTLARLRTTSPPIITFITMNTLAFSFRASARRAPLASARIPRASFRSSFRKYSTEAPPPKSSNTALYATIGLAVVGGFGYYVYTSSDTAATTVKSGAQTAKSALKFTPARADYQKVSYRPRVLSTLRAQFPISGV